MMVTVRVNEGTLEETCFSHQLQLADVPISWLITRTGVSSLGVVAFVPPH